MTLTETAAHGLTLEIHNGASPGTYAELLGVHNGPSGGGWSPRIIEAFHHSSTTVKKYATVVDTGDVTFSLYYDSTDTVHQQLRDAAKNKTQSLFRVTLTETGAEVLTFNAFVSWEYDADPENWNMVNVTLSINGDIGVA